MIYTARQTRRKKRYKAYKIIENYLCKEYYKSHKEEIRKRRQDRNKLLPEINTFLAIEQRCNNPNNPRYTNYGGRGIKCLLRTWQEIINSIGPRPGINYSIDRINNDGNYELGNIRWATSKQQANNRRLRK